MSRMTKKIIAVIATCACAFCMFAFVGCGSTSDMMGVVQNSTPESYYLSSLNSLMSEINNSLDGFNDTVKNKDIDAMKKTLDATQNTIDKINKLDVPENCKDVQAKYLDGLNSMQKCFSDYIQVFTDQKEGKITNEVLAQRVAEIQKSYNSAMNSLKEADKLASSVLS
ncbi:MAG: hypothetical protein Q4E88_03685 [Coriobacteriia bacterium]|nr:hypothetical protein [Coriobacteriia bacterium]